jgi:hypothetical protein
LRDAEKARGFQVFSNNLVWDNVCTQVVSGPVRGDALLNIYPHRPCNVLPGISDHNRVSWDEVFQQLKLERIVVVCNKTDILGFKPLFGKSLTYWLQMAVA